VPDEYGNTTTSVVGSTVTGGGSASMAIEARDWSPCARVDGDDVYVRAALSTASRARGASSAVVTSIGIGILQLKRRFLDGVRRIDRGKDGTGGARPRGRPRRTRARWAPRSRRRRPFPTRRDSPAATRRI